MAANRISITTERISTCAFVAFTSIYGNGNGVCLLASRDNRLKLDSRLITPTERIAVGGIFYAQLSMGCFGRRTGKHRPLLGFRFGGGTIWRNISLWHLGRQRERVVYYRIVRHAHRP